MEMVGLRGEVVGLGEGLRGVVGEGRGGKGFGW